VSNQHWELLAKITTAKLTDLAAVCQGLAREADAERLFCVISTASGEHVLAIDCDGYPLGFGAERLSDSGFSDLVLRVSADDRNSVEPQVVRRVSRASKRTVIAGRIRVGGDLGVSVILENRFAGEALAGFDDTQVTRWLILLGLVARLNAVGEQPASGVQVGSHGTDAAQTAKVGVVAVSTPPAATSPVVFEQSEAQDPRLDQRQREDTLGALHQEHWNISRAARRLGMTRHGLKKRMRRLSLLKSTL
jgi:hypothetical protein